MNQNAGDGELFLHNDWLQKGIKPYFKSGPQSKILTIANVTCHKQDLNLCRMWVHPVLKKIQKSISVDLQHSNNMNSHLVGGGGMFLGGENEQIFGW